MKERGWQLIPKSVVRLATPFAVVAAGLAVVSCHKPLAPPVSKEAFAIHRLEVEDQKHVLDSTFVFIEGEDIQLPWSTGKLSPMAEQRRTYSFYVWAYHPSKSTSRTLDQLRQSGDFVVDVVGARANIVVPSYGSTAVPTNVVEGLRRGALRVDTGDLASRCVLEVQVRSDDVHKPFSIVAWFPDDYLRYLEPTNTPFRAEAQGVLATRENPWGRKKNVRVYSGDLQTRVEIVSEREVVDSFGKNFERYFHVGKVFLRNRHPDKRLVVYTTSMRAPVLLYRPPAEKQRRQRELNAEETARLERRKGSQQTNILQSLEWKEIVQISDAALELYPQFLRLSPTERDKKAREISDQIVSTNAMERAARVDKAVQYVHECWATVARHIARLQSQAKAAELQADSAADRTLEFLQKLGAPQAMKGELRDLARAKDFLTLDRLWQKIDSDLAKTTPPGTATDENKERADWWFNLRTDAAKAARAIRDHRYLYLQSHALALALESAGLSGSRGPSDADGRDTELLADLLSDTRARIRDEAAGRLYAEIPETPFSHELDILMNPDGRPLAFSRNAEFQKKMSEVGYLFRETYRPMTFQGVLNSLMQTHESDWKTRVVKALEMSARIAGGLVALGSVVNELSSDGYVTGVSVFSTLIVPEVRTLLLEDLNKKIRNLGEMGLDTVVVVQPNEVVDRYVFFPKGPIYNQADEFDVNDPAYIVRIDNDDVAVRGDHDRGGYDRQRRLVGRAAVGGPRAQRGSCGGEHGIAKAG